MADEISKPAGDADDAARPAASETLTGHVVPGAASHVRPVGHAPGPLAGPPGSVVDERDLEIEWKEGVVIDGKYRVSGSVGRGGMGVVQKVRHLEWNLDLAVKTPLPALVGAPELRARFVREAQTWVDLGMHPHIVQCWYVRELGGLPRVFADFMPGGSLKDWIRNGKVRPGDWRLLLDLAIQACDGLAYAHERGLVHRDVKPANLLMGSDGRLCVADFGLVKLPRGETPAGRAVVVRAQEAASQTLSGSELGTLEYGAPEQWGAAQSADARADLYALGGVLFELSCGRRAFDDGSHAEPKHVLIGRHLAQLAPDVREFNPDVPERLAASIAQCLAKRPDDRPESAAALRKELAAIFEQVTGEVYAREPPRAADLRADALNNRGVSLWELGDQSGAFDAWNTALEIDGLHPEALYNHSLLSWRCGKITDLTAVNALGNVKEKARARAYLGYLHLERGAASEAESELTSALESPEVAADAEAWRALGDARMGQQEYWRAAPAYQKVLELLPGDARATRAMQLAREGRRGDNGRVEFASWRLRTVPLDLGKDTGEMHLTRDGKSLITVGAKGGVDVWDLSKVVRRCLLHRDDGVRRAAAVTPDNRHVVTGGEDAVVSVWDLTYGSCEHTLKDHQQSVTAVGVLPRDPVAISGDAGGCSRVWDLSTGRCLCVLEGGPDLSIERFGLTESGFVTCLYRIREARDAENRVVPEPRHLARWDLSNGRYRGCVEVPPLAAHTPSLRFGVSTSYEKPTHIWRFWDLSTGDCLRTFEGVQVTSQLVLAAEGRVIMACREESLEFWDTSIGAPFAKLPARSPAACLPRDDGRLAIVLTWDGAMSVYEMSLRETAPLGRPHDLVGSLLLGASDGQSMKQRGPSAGRCVQTHRLDNLPHAFAMTEDCQVAAFWEGPPRRRLSVLELSGSPTHRTAPLQLSQQGSHSDSLKEQATFDRYLADAEANFEAGRATVACEHLLKARAVPGYERHPLALALNVSLAEKLQRTGLRAAWPTGVAVNHESVVRAVAIRPDGGAAVSGTEDGALRYWSLPGGKLLRFLPAPPRESHGLSGVTKVAWTRESSVVAVSYQDTHVRLWNLASGQCVGHDIGWEMLTLRTQSLGLRAFGTRNDGAFGLWDLSGNHRRAPPVRILGKVQPGVRPCAVVTPDGRYVVWAGGRQPHLSMWDMETGKHLRNFQDGEARAALAVATTADGRSVLSGHADGTLRIWDTRSAKCKRVLKGVPSGELVVVPSGRFFVSCGGGRLSFWDLETGECVTALPHDSRVNAASITPDGWLLLLGIGHRVAVWELDWQLESHHGPTSLARRFTALFRRES